MHGPPTWNSTREATQWTTAWSTNKCHACFNFSRLCFGSPILHSDSSPPLASHASRRSSWNIWIRSFKVSGRSKASKQASKQVYIHTHVHNAVTLVWSSLRLTPIRWRNATWGVPCSQHLVPMTYLQLHHHRRMTFAPKSHEIEASQWTRSVYHLEKLDTVVYLLGWGKEDSGADSCTKFHHRRLF